MAEVLNVVVLSEPENGRLVHRDGDFDLALPVTLVRGVRAHDAVVVNTADPRRSGGVGDAASGGQGLERHTAPGQHPQC